MNLRPPRPERGALPDCATLRHVPVGRRSYRLDACGRQASSRNFFSCIHMPPWGKCCNGREAGARSVAVPLRPPLVDNARPAPSARPGRRIGVASGRRSNYGPPRLSAVGASPSGKAAVFGTAIRRFESCRPSQIGPPGHAVPPPGGGTHVVIHPQAADHAFCASSFLTSVSARSAAGRETSGAQ